MIDGIYEHRHAQRIGEENKLLAFLVAHLARSGQELDTQLPLFLGEFNLTNKSV
jgi:hypothetical protein